MELTEYLDDVLFPFVLAQLDAWETYALSLGGPDVDLSAARARAEEFFSQVSAKAPAAVDPEQPTDLPPAPPVVDPAEPEPVNP